MSGFDTGWLALREPADHAARHGGLIDALTSHLGGLVRPALLDIGCGTGSTWRSLADRLPEGTSWRMLDNDPLLLAEAERRIGGDGNASFHRHDLNDIDTLPLTGVDMVTASALFDLCSETFCTALADRLASAGCGLYAALNYDGVMRWDPAHPLDEHVVDLFNTHQRTDKGLGPALGPDATSCLARLLKERGFVVRIEHSPWRLGAETAGLQAALLQGIRGPLLEMASLPSPTIDGWLQDRLAEIGGPDHFALVGHMDLLALPA